MAVRVWKQSRAGRGRDFVGPDRSPRRARHKRRYAPSSKRRRAYPCLNTLRSEDRQCRFIDADLRERCAARRSTWQGRRLASIYGAEFEGRSISLTSVAISNSINVPRSPAKYDVGASFRQHLRGHATATAGSDELPAIATLHPPLPSHVFLRLERRRGYSPNPNSPRGRRVQISARLLFSTALLRTTVLSTYRDPRR